MIGRTIGFVLSLSLLTSCGADALTAPTIDFISIDSIVPAAGTTLVAGERATFTVVATCTIVSAESGFTALIVQDQRNMALGLFDTRLVPIFVGSSTETRAVAVRTYAVR